MVKSFSIVLDNPSVLPGEVVTGQVLLETKPQERIKARAVRLSLYGAELVELTRGGHDAERVYRAHKEFVRKSLTLLGFPKQSPEESFFLEAGRKYAFPFTFKLPDDCLPSCTYSQSKTIAYLLESNIDKPGKIDDECSADLRVHPNSDVASAPPHYSTELEEELTPTACCCFPKGAVRLKVEVDKTASWWEDDLSAKVTVDNSHCEVPIKKVLLSLSIVSTYTAKGHVDTHRHTLAVKEFPEDGVEIPRQAPEVNFRHTFTKEECQLDPRFPTSTIHGEHITHKFVVRGVAKYSFGEYAVELPTFVADGPSRPGFVANVPTFSSTRRRYPDYPSSESDHGFYDPERERGPDVPNPDFYEKEEYGTGREEYRNSETG